MRGHEPWLSIGPGLLWAALWVTIMVLTLAAPSLAAQKINTNGSNFAIGGYDPVVYFTDRKAIKGAQKFTHNWGGKTWRFRSRANRNAYASMPDKYAPAYGGYCAYGVAQGCTYKIDPRAFSIENNKLYLNYSKGIKKRFDSDRAVYIAKANSNWPTLSQ